MHVPSQCQTPPKTSWYTSYRYSNSSKYPRLESHLFQILIHATYFSRDGTKVTELSGILQNLARTATSLSLSHLNDVILFDWTNFFFFFYQKKLIQLVVGFYRIHDVEKPGGFQLLGGVVMLLQNFRFNNIHPWVILQRNDPFLSPYPYLFEDN